ncbi:uncharacterized protein LOC105186543 [Harpegnathos saltator]|uniref:uncharacterized protein LOC105186543 n=1 Tax=Harpegnathos saltator TaxID=610380 RepID=UPI00058B352F|nr:uncharacterized protein LOC105186543 [Harpegnathos saltator]
MRTMSLSRQYEHFNIDMSEVPPQFSPWGDSYSIRNYRNHFNPNVCHLCKLDVKKIRISKEDYTLCHLCKMILFCSHDHASIHSGNHAEICDVLKKLSRKYPQYWRTKNFSREDWIQSRKDLLDIVQKKLQRDMKLYEIQMIMFAKSCFICHKQRNLQACTGCFCVNYCSNHAEDFENYHSPNCVKLKSCLETDYYLFRTPLCYYRYYWVNTFTMRNVVDMQQFITSFMNYKPDHLNKFYSDYLSGPLTLYGMIGDYLDIQDSHYIVHIIQTKVLDVQYVLAWEIMLHALRTLQHLEVVLIGTELDTDVHVKVNVCLFCVRFGKTFEFQYNCHMQFDDYLDYMLLSKSQPRPNVIIAFETDISDLDLRAEVILKLRKQSCPFIVTAGSLFKFQRNVHELKKILRAPLDLTPIENKFSSVRAYRNFEDDDVSFRNKFLIIFKKLRNLYKLHKKPNNTDSSCS